MKTLFKNLVRVGFASSLLLGAACGDDGDGDDGDNCTGGAHSPATGEDCVSTFELPEGADIRIEYYQVSPDAAEDLAGMQAIFWRNQVPDVRAFEGTPIGPEGSGCTDLRNLPVFDSGYSDEAQGVADSRAYFSVGDNVTFTSEASGTNWVINKAEDVIDFSATLTHGVAATTDTWGFDKKASAPPVAADMNLGDWYNVEIPGSDDMASIDFSAAFEASGDGPVERDFKGVYLPAAFTMTQPAEADFYAQTIPNRDAYTLKWDVGTETADAPGVLPFVTILNAETGKGEFMCIVPNDGELVIPAEIMAEAPQSGMMLFGIFAHIAWEQDLHAQHTLGVTCKFAEYTIEEVQP